MIGLGRMGAKVAALPLAVEDDQMNIICMGGRTVGPSVAWDLVQTFLAAKFSDAPRHLRRLTKVAQLELQPTRKNQ